MAARAIKYKQAIRTLDTKLDCEQLDPEQAIRTLDTTLGLVRSVCVSTQDKCKLDKCEMLITCGALSPDVSHYARPERIQRFQHNALLLRQTVDFGTDLLVVVEPNVVVAEVIDEYHEQVRWLLSAIDTLTVRSLGHTLSSDRHQRHQQVTQHADEANCFGVVRGNVDVCLCVCVCVLR